jgi:hypothetical protein
MGGVPSPRAIAERLAAVAGHDILLSYRETAPVQGAGRAPEPARLPAAVAPFPMDLSNWARRLTPSRQPDLATD